jgi:hypothetical protein
VTQNHISAVVVLIGSTKTGVRDLDQDLGRTNLLGGCRLNDHAILEILEDSELDHLLAELCIVYVSVREVICKVRKCGCSYEFEE